MVWPWLGRSGPRPPFASATLGLRFCLCQRTILLRGGLELTTWASVRGSWSGLFRVGPWPPRQATSRQRRSDAATARRAGRRPSRPAAGQRWRCGTAYYPGRRAPARAAAVAPVGAAMPPSAMPPSAPVEQSARLAGMPVRRRSAARLPSRVPPRARRPRREAARLEAAQRADRGRERPAAQLSAACRWRAGCALGGSPA